MPFVPKMNNHDLVYRFEGNPIITADDLPFPCLGLHNAGAVKIGETYILLLRVEDMRGRSFFAVARSEDGYRFVVDEKPVLLPAKKGPFAVYEELGIEDPRITQLDGKYYITYTAHSHRGSRLALATTKNFKTFRRLRLLTEPENRSGALMPRMFGDRFALLERPLVGDSGHLWISYSKDLTYWGDARAILDARGGFWDCHRVGVGCPPIATDKGWLLIYYGTKHTSGGMIYRIGSALLDSDDPSAVIGRCDIPILTPREYYERVGDVDNMVFTTGAVVDELTGNLMIYYGAATNAICLGLAKIDDLIDRCLR